MAIYQFGDEAPSIHAEAWVADTATVIGRVTLERQASVWYGAVLRGDNDRMTIGQGSNIQDGSVLHVDAGVPLSIGAGVSVGHQVMLHGCTIGDGTLVGIQSVVLNGARIGRHCLIGAGALVTEGKEFPDGVMILGSPAKVVRELTPQQITHLQVIARHYVEQLERHRSQLKRIDR
jgi:carbonic anhydrase/acetyltransferase-like protein (isoleucine patch superfamily)